MLAELWFWTQQENVNLCLWEKTKEVIWRRKPQTTMINKGRYCSIQGLLITDICVIQPDMISLKYIMRCLLADIALHDYLSRDLSSDTWKLFKSIFNYLGLPYPKAFKNYWPLLLCKCSSTLWALIFHVLIIST